MAGTRDYKLRLRFARNGRQTFVVFNVAAAPFLAVLISSAPILEGIDAGAGWGRGAPASAGVMVMVLWIFIALSNAVVATVAATIALSLVQHIRSAFSVLSLVAIVLLANALPSGGWAVVYGSAMLSDLPRLFGAVALAMCLMSLLAVPFGAIKRVPDGLPTA